MTSPSANTKRRTSCKGLECQGRTSTKAVPSSRKPPWIRVRLLSGKTFQLVRHLKQQKALHTVCEEALCPNIGDCWGRGTATFLILGDTCTRNCRFCAVKKTDHPAPPAPDEPRRVAEAVKAMRLRHVVITSVTRDDLSDGGASFFAATIKAVHEMSPESSVEVLIPDFQGSLTALATVVEAQPDIIGHNMETVERLYPGIRPRASYHGSLSVLRALKQLNPGIITKSGIMLGLGETRSELLKTCEDLRRVRCDILTLGQYLQPRREQVLVERYLPPHEFNLLKQTTEQMGFKWVEAGPLVRSSYHAEEQAQALKCLTSFKH